MEFTDSQDKGSQGQGMLEWPLDSCSTYVPPTLTSSGTVLTVSLWH